MDENTPKIILLVNLKGGAGKSTSVNHLAHAAHARGIDSCIVDCDPNRTLYSMGERITLSVPVYKVNVDDASEFESIQELKHTYIFVDTPPNNSEIIKDLALIADEVIIPVAPTGFDIDLLEKTVRQVAKIEKARQVALLSILIIKYRLNVNSSEVSLATLKQRAGEYPVLDSVIRQLDVYTKYQKPEKLDEYIGVLRELELI